MWSNYHTHSHFCDGKGMVRDYLESAKKKGVRQIGMSSHAPLPFPCKWCMKREAFPQYLHEIESARQDYPELEVYKGLEIDFIPRLVGPADFDSQLDFTIGSIHFVDSINGKHWEIDNTIEVFREGLLQIFQNDIRSAISRYYHVTREMLQTSPPDILGHMDKIKINAIDTLFEESESWYKDEIDRTLRAIRETATIVEVNTRGIYKKKSATTYPSPWILERIFQMGIPVTLSSDAHHPDDLTREYPRALALIKEIGFKNVSVLKKGIWMDMPLSEYGTNH